jgi:hypothetical protein
MNEVTLGEASGKGSAASHGVGGIVLVESSPTRVAWLATHAKLRVNYEKLVCELTILVILTQLPPGINTQYQQARHEHSNWLRTIGTSWTH